MTATLITLAVIALVVGVVLFARRKIKGSDAAGSNGGGGRPGADKH